MGFFSGLAGLAGGLSGMAGGPKQSQAVPASGLYSMPRGYQGLWGNLTEEASQIFAPNGVLDSSPFNPMGVQPIEQQALDAYGRGFTPTEDSLRSDISMFMNPFDDHVINDINRQSQGQYSVLNQALNRAGQTNSNRGILGASDIESQRLGQIGQFRQNQYNTAVNNALGLGQSRAQDATLQMGAGEFLRNLDLQGKQAPYSALNAQTSILGGIPTQFGTSSPGGTATSGSSGGSILDTVSQGAGLIGKLGGLSGIASSIAGLFSDERLKENVHQIDVQNDIPIYSFNYENDDVTYRGVMAQDVLVKMPEAIKEIEGFMMVDYDMLGINMERYDGNL